MKRAWLIMLLLCGFGFAQKKDEMPPLPSKLVVAKTIFLTVDTDWTEGHTKHAYSELKKWGRFEVVADPEKADLIFSITNKDAGTMSFNTGTATLIGGTYATGGGLSIPVVLHTYYLRVYDREKGTLLFVASTDERLAKSAESKRLISALKKRITEAKP